MFKFWMAVETPGGLESEGVTPSDVKTTAERMRKDPGAKVLLRICLERDGDIVRNEDGGAVEVSFEI